MASNWGIRSLADTYFRYFQPGMPTYLRRQAVDPEDLPGVELGFVPQVTGFQSGVVDTPIQPAVDVQEVSLHNIGISGGKLRYGARVFLISHTFVLQQMAQYGLTDPWDVWRGETVMGLYYDRRLFTIESITHEDFGGAPVLWKLICNASDESSPGPTLVGQ